MFRLNPVSTLTLAALAVTAGLTLYTPLTHAEVPASQGQITLSFAPVVQSAAPVVVNIYTAILVPAGRDRLAGDPLFDLFFQGMEIWFRAVKTHSVRVSSSPPTGWPSRTTMGPRAPTRSASC